VRSAGFSFRETARDGTARTGLFVTPRAEVRTPVFMPVGTLATVKSQAPDEIEATGARLILANTYHLWLRPGPEVVETLGGVPKFMGWPHAMLTDSGGFQVFSLSDLRSIDDDGVTFRSHLDGRKLRLTPEESMRIQRCLGADVAMAFDECPPGGAPEDVVRAAMRRTTAWAERCLRAPWKDGQARFGIVQGGTSAALRREHLDAIAGMEAGGRSFDGLALGGLSVGEPIVEMHRTMREIAPLLPADRPRYVMGIGTPFDLLEAMRAGVDLFDCVLPTRNARNGQALTWSGRVNLKQARHRTDEAALDPRCGCSTCRRHSRAYLHHLVRTDEMLGARLLTHHNLFFYGALCAEARAAIEDGRYERFAGETAAGLREGDEVGSADANAAPRYAKKDPARAARQAKAQSAHGLGHGTGAKNRRRNVDAMELLSGRRSVSKLKEPAPPADVVERVLASALRAPDHGTLRPWRVFKVAGEARAAFGEVLAEALVLRKPDATGAELEDAKRKALRAPLLLVVAATITTGKVPEIEQVMSAATVAHGLLLGFQAEGWGAVWKTGAPAYDPHVKVQLGLSAEDHVVSILYVGTVAEEPQAQKRPTVADVVIDWTGPRGHADG
jgi:queuine tRNA-ribosyltransferase